MTSYAMIPSCDVDSVLARRDAIVRHASQLQALSVDAPEGFPRLWLNEGKGLIEFDHEFIHAQADRSGWCQLIQASGLWDFMDHVAREEWRRSLDDGTFPPLNRENIEATITQVYHDRKAMVTRGVAEVYRQLDASYKSNRPMCFGRRVVIRYVADTGYRGAAFANHRVADKLDDLDRFLRLLRGLPEQTRELAAFRQVSRALRGPAPWAAEFDFFWVKVWKNGNGHLTWKHDVDRQRLNKLLALSGPNQIGGRG